MKIAQRAVASGEITENVVVNERPAPVEPVVTSNKQDDKTILYVGIGLVVLGLILNYFRF